MRASRGSSVARCVSIAALLSSSLVACGGSAATGGSGTNGGTGTATGASCESVSLSGLVNFNQLALSTGSIVTASFYGQPITGEVDFGCNAACKFTPRGDGGASFDGGLDVGTVTASDLTSGAFKNLTEASSVYFTSSFAWAAGDMLQIAGGGGTFPAFAISLPSPATLTVTSPSGIAAGETVMASQGTGLTVAWQPSTPPASFMGVGILASVGEIDCYPPDSAGTLTISPSMLSNIPVGSYSMGQGLTVGRWTTAVDTFGGKTIGVQVQEYLNVGLQIGP